MQTAIVSLAAASSARRFSRAAPLVLAVGVGLSVFVLASPAIAQDTAKADSASPVATKSDATSERAQRRAERRQTDAAKQAETAAKTETLAKFPKAGEAAAGAAPQPKLECRTQDVTGSRVPKRLCATREQWAVADADAEEAIRNLKRTSGDKSTLERPGPNPFGGAVR